MLARATRRYLRRDAFKHSPSTLTQLSLPWLCPAQMRFAAISRSTTNPQILESRKQKTRPDTRSISTSADAVPASLSQLPLQGLVSPWQMHAPAIASPEVAWNPSNLLVVHRSLAETPFSTPFKQGIGGDGGELLQNLHACLRVGRVDRAAAIVEKIMNMFKPSAPEIMSAHNTYLQALLDRALEDPVAPSMEGIESWFIEKIVRYGAEPDAQTFIILLRSSINLLQGVERDAAVRKYLGLVQQLGPEAFEEVNTSPDFTDDEWDLLIKAQPEMFEEVPSADPAAIDAESPILSTPEALEIATEKGLARPLSTTIRSVPQKGSGLKSLQAALASFEPGKGVPFPHEIEGDPEEKARAYAYMRQVHLEKTALEAAVQRWKAEDERMSEMGVYQRLERHSIKAMMWNWYAALLPLVRKEVAEIKEILSDPSKAASDERLIYGPYLEPVSPEKLAAVTVQTVMQYIATTRQREARNVPLKITLLNTAIGRNVQHEVVMAAEEEKLRQEKDLRPAHRKKLLRRIKTQMLKNAASIIVTPPVPDKHTLVRVDDPFPLHVQLRIGAMLVDKFIKVATMDISRVDPRTGKKVYSSQPAFSISTGLKNGRRLTLLIVRHELREMLTTDESTGISDHLLPMVAEPRPWTGFQEGGYYTRKNPLVRTNATDEAQKLYAVSAIGRGDMDSVMTGLDVLGRVPWKINDNVFRVAAEAWNRGEGVGKLIPNKVDLQPPKELAPDATPLERVKYMQKLREYENTTMGFHSQKCFQNLQLEIARAYKDETFYFPHSVDYRGRCYPIPPVLNHIGSDLPRGLLMFAKGKELGTVGLQWLKIHLANLYGFDKASLREREEFTMEHIAEIYDSATNPLTGNRWWTTAEDPWQCLACCFELKNALDSPDPTKYISHMPVHQDGSCNGLQHYAALGGDEAGATQVNLEPGDRPQDIYTAVADLVREAVAEDAKAENPIAKLLDGKITRKVVKRTVMTNVYGVTFQGAKLQVYDELVSIFPKFEETPEIGSLMGVSSYVALQIFAALRKIFNGARDIQDWLVVCGSRITTSVTQEQIKSMQRHFKGHMEPHGKYIKNASTSKVLERKNEKNWEFRSSVIWTTPLKMPVVQPYREATAERIATLIGQSTIVRPRITDAVSRRKQLQGFPPNFIHSLDASHMLLSAIKSEEAGLTFAAVHDSFWTHAADVPKLSVILRDEFIRMHSEDIIGRLRAEFQTRYAGNMYRASLNPKHPVAQEIMEWRRVVLGVGQKSQTPRLKATYKELAMEADRLELLNSDKEEDREKGKAMVTPTSIFLKARDSVELSEEERPVLLGDSIAANRLGRGDPEEEKTKSPEEDESVDEDMMDADLLVAEASEGGVDADGLGDDIASQSGKSADKTTKAKAKKAKKTPLFCQGCQIWVPLEFPEVPKKGSWDINRLKESKYFFS